MAESRRRGRPRAALGEKWKATGYSVSPVSAVEVMRDLGAIGVYSTGQQFAWRGVSSIDYSMESSLQRRMREQGLEVNEANVRAQEVDTLERARKWGLGVGRYGKVDDLQLLADLQHYGIPTRLLDFTSNPMTALWFACQSPSAPAGGNSPSPSGLVLALNITDWKTYSSGDAPLTYATVDHPWTGTLEQALQGPPFLVRAVEPNPRIAAQEGFFAAGAVPSQASAHDVFQSFTMSFSSIPMGELSLEVRGRGAPPKLPFVAVVIRSNLKSKLLRYLDGTFNRSARVLFPDFPGFREFGTASGSKEPSEAFEVVDFP